MKAKPVKPKQNNKGNGTNNAQFGAIPQEPSNMGYP